MVGQVMVDLLVDGWLVLELVSMLVVVVVAFGFDA